MVVTTDHGTVLSVMVVIPSIRTPASNQQGATLQTNNSSTQSTRTFAEHQAATTIVAASAVPPVQRLTARCHRPGPVACTHSTHRRIKDTQHMRNRHMTRTKQSLQAVRCLHLQQHQHWVCIDAHHLTSEHTSQPRTNAT